MPFNVYEFRNNGAFDGLARPNKFEILMTFPLIGVANPLLAGESRYLAESASLPPSIMGVVDIPYMGRTIKAAGDPEYPNWSVSFQNREDFDLKNSFEQWHNAINSHVGNLMLSAYDNINDGYKVDFIATQYSKSGAVIKVYNFVGAFPVNVGAIQLAWDNKNSYETFDVEFAYDFWTDPNTTDV